VDISRFTDYRAKIIDNCSKAILGKEDSIFLVLICFICSGHVLLEDVPGTGKTMLLRSFAKTIGGGFKRVQFTPDLLPSDLTGINFYNMKTGEFEFRRGPLFANIVLADEINRATPRTQSSLLEAMEERQITVDGTTHVLEEPFMVMATQNPLESYGTFPLPDAQIDRFFMRLSLGYMQRGQELDVISRASTLDIVEALQQVVTDEETDYVRREYHNINVSADVAGYIMDIIEGTRTESSFFTGVSTRGAIALYKASQACAALNGRDYVLPEDVRFVAPNVLIHRLNIGGGARTEGTADMLGKIIDKVQVPIENLS
jgi:MoxR-like ATPase